MAVSPPFALSEANRVPIASIDPSPSNPRRNLMDIEPLAQSIRELGMLQPIAVRKCGARYELLAGHRRLAAFCLLHERKPADPRWCWIPAVVVLADDATAYEALIAGQAQIRAWDATAEAKVLDQLVARGMTLGEIGKLFGRDNSWVSRRRRVLADPALAEHVFSGELAVSTAEQLLVISDVDERRKVGRRAATEHWSEAHARRAVRSHLASLTKALLRELDSVQVHAISDAVWADLNALRAKIEATVPRAVGVAA